VELRKKKRKEIMEIEGCKKMPAGTSRSLETLKKFQLLISKKSRLLGASGKLHIRV